MRKTRTVFYCDDCKREVEDNRLVTYSVQAGIREVQKIEGKVAIGVMEISELCIDCATSRLKKYQQIAYNADQTRWPFKD